MLVLFYYNWKGTREERTKFEKEHKEKWSKIKGVKVMGYYTPTTAWNRAILLETDSFDTMIKYGSEPDPNFINTDLVILM